MRRWLSFVALTAAFALATSLTWWGVAVVGALWGALRPKISAPAATAAVAVALAWSGWLFFDHLAARDRLVDLMVRVEGVLRLPGVAIVIITLLFGVLLAWSVTALAGGIMDILAPRAGGSQ